MLLINFDKKAIYIPLPKTGQKYISYILTTFYGFIEWENRPDEIADYFHSEDALLQSLDNYDSKYFSITKGGLVRFCLHDSLDIDNKHIKYLWNSFFKFTFINNPYRKFTSSYLCSTNNQYQSDVFLSSKINNEQIFKCKMKDFIDYKDQLPNLCLYTSFVSQKNHLIDKKGEINLQYIGQTSDIDYELILVLNHLGFKDMKHLDTKNLNDKFIQKFEIMNNFQEYIDNECIDSINTIISEDIDLFNFNKITDKNNINIYPTSYMKNDAIATAKIIFDYYEKQLIIESNNMLTNILKEHIEGNNKLLNEYFKVDTNNLLIRQHNLLVEKYFKNINKNNQLNSSDISDILCMNKSLKLNKFNCDKCKFCTYNNTALLCHYKTVHNENITYSNINNFIENDINENIYDLDLIHNLGYKKAYYPNNNKSIVIIPEFFSNDICNYIINIGKDKENNNDLDSTYMNYIINEEVDNNSQSNFSKFILSKYNIDKEHLDETSRGGFRCFLPSNELVCMQYDNINLFEKLIQIIGYDRQDVTFPDLIQDDIFDKSIVRDQSIVHYRENEGIPPHMDDTKHTILCYLNDVDINSGGRTIFPENDIYISPKKGTVVIYSSIWDLLHYSEKIKEGEKWIMQLLID